MSECQIENNYMVQNFGIPEGITPRDRIDCAGAIAFFHTALFIQRIKRRSIPA